MKDYNITQESVQNLTADTIYSSTEIYKIFDQPKLGGNSRTAFNKRLSQFVSYIYDPKDCLYYITEIYSYPLPDERSTKYDKLIKILLLNYLLQQENNTAVLGRKQWWEQLNMVNPQYLSLSHKTTSFPNMIDLTPIYPFGKPPEDVIQYNIQTFFRQSYSQLNNIFKRTLTRLQRQSFILYSDCFLIKEFGTARIATDDEADIILGVRRAELNRLGLDNLGQLIFKPNLYDHFYKTCATSLYRLHHLSADPNLQIFDCIKIIFTKEGMAQQIERDTRKLEEAGVSLNQMIMAWANNWAKVTGQPIKQQLIDLCADTYIARTSDN